MSEQNRKVSAHTRDVLLELTKVQLESLQEQVEELRQSLLSEQERLAEAPSPEVNPFVSVKKILEVRRRRDEIFGGQLFGEPAWDLLLELYLADLSGIRLSMTKVSHMSALPPSTALRWINKLLEEGLIEKVLDHLDARRSWISLSDRGRASMRVAIEQMRS